MQTRTSRRPSLESLEDRLCPALSVTFDGSNLTIGDGALMGATNSGTLNVTQNAADVTIADGATPLGTYAVTGRISVRLNNAPATVNFNLGGNSTAGDVSLTLGNGGNTVDFFADGMGGTIGGSLTVNSGNGMDSVDLDSKVIGGSANINLGAGLDTLQTGVTLGVTVGGSLYGTGVNNLGNAVSDGFVTGGDAIFNSGSELLSNQYNFNGIGVATPTSIGRNLSITTGSGPTDVIVVEGTVQGSLIASLGNGTNTFTLAVTAIVLGNLNVTTGSGITDNITLESGSMVLGNVSASLGNGTNTLTLRGTIAGSSITFVGGNDADSLIYGMTAVATGARLNAYLGNGVDTFQLDASTLASAYVDFGFGADVYAQNAAAVTFPLTLRNL